MRHDAISKCVELVRSFRKEHGKHPTSIVFGWEDAIDLILIQERLPREHAAALMSVKQKEVIKTFIGLSVVGWDAEETRLE